MTRGLVVNEIGVCKRCGEWHRYLTKSCRPLVMRLEMWTSSGTVPWRWSMLWRADWWSIPLNSARFGKYAWRRRWCRIVGHDDTTIAPTHPVEHRVIACRRCYRAVDLEPDDVQARTGRAIYHIPR